MANNPSGFVELSVILESLDEANRSPVSGTSALGAQVVPGSEMTPAQVALWHQLQSGDPQLANPCFCPGFTQAVAKVRTDVRVAFIRQGREVVAIFPFQRKRSGRGIPVGGIVSDYHGLICRPDFSCDPRELLRVCGLVAWDFDRLLASQSFLSPYHRLCEPSAQIDLSSGYQSYAAERRAFGTRQITQCEYMIRRIERTLGPVCFVAHSTNSKALAQVLAWKSEQYRQSGWKDQFARSWARRLVERIHALQLPGFAGILSLLYAGEHLVAGHFGMRSGTVWHYWFPAYDRLFARFSPGLILLMKMAESAEKLGLRCIDLGTGLSLYKRRMMNASISVAEGSIERPSCLLLVRSMRRKLKSLIGSNGFRRFCRAD